MNSYLESMNPIHANLLAWGVVALIGLACLALTIHRCGLRPGVRFGLLAVLILAGLAGVILLNPAHRGDVNQAGRQSPAVGVTSESDLIAIQQVIEGIGREYVSGMYFKEDGHIEPIISPVPVERGGASKLYAVQFQEGVATTGNVLKVVVYSGTPFEVPIGEQTQVVEVIASGDGDVLVSTEERLEFVNPRGDQSGSDILVEEVMLANI